MNKVLVANVRLIPHVHWDLTPHQQPVIWQRSTYNRGGRSQTYTWVEPLTLHKLTGQLAHMKNLVLGGIQTQR